MKKILVASLILAGACASEPRVLPREISTPTVAGQAYLSLLVRFLTGTFETVRQEASVGDSTPVKLRQGRFWVDRPGEYWMYAEYSRPGEDQRPFVQRIYGFTESNGVITAAVYRLPGDPASFVGEWRKDKPFAGFLPRDLKEREGCRIDFVNQMEVVFNGGRKGTSCHSDRPGVDHEHAEFYVSSSSIRTWEPGLDASGKQVAGLPGASDFRKILQFPQ
ncbi:MAG: chromophore lyase CpcT/CpeT [Usitatibacter sp.]